MKSDKSTKPATKPKADKPATKPKADKPATKPKADKPATKKPVPIAIAKIQPAWENPRGDGYSVADIMSTMAVSTDGVACPRIPIMVRPVGNTYEIVYGERRYQAARNMGATYILSEVQALTDREAARIRAEENAGRENLTCTERASEMHRLHEVHRFSLSQIARSMTGGDVDAVRRCMLLLEAIPAVLDALHKGEIKETVAMHFARHTPDEQQRAWNRLVGTHTMSDQAPLGILPWVRGLFALLPLSKAPWPIADPTIDASGAIIVSSCKGCSRRSDAQVTLPWETGQGAECLDGQCYDKKAKAWKAYTDALSAAPAPVEQADPAYPVDVASPAPAPAVDVASPAPAPAVDVAPKKVFPDQDVKYIRGAYHGGVAHAHLVEMIRAMYPREARAAKVICGDDVENTRAVEILVVAIAMKNQRARPIVEEWYGEVG